MTLKISVVQRIAHLLVEEYDFSFDYLEREKTHWKKRIDVELPIQTIVKVILDEVDRNVKEYGIVGLCESWERNGDIFPINQYLKLKGIKHHYKRLIAKRGWNLSFYEG